jgi:hypothetical protein
MRKMRRVSWLLTSLTELGVQFIDVFDRSSAFPDGDAELSNRTDDAKFEVT